MEVQVIKAKALDENGVVKRHNRLRVAAYCRVSTDEKDQIKSYNSMVQHYTDYIKKNSDWEFAGVYADKAATGTSVNKRPEFQNLIAECLNGKIDLVIAKSLSRFARNTLDTVKYVRLLKEKGVGIYFENENINTLKDGEFLMTILSSVAQQEVENTSANVKKGLAMRMQRGEVVCFQGCLGYDYDYEKKEIVINEKEADTVRYIFERYASGAGSTVIARELNEKGIKTRKGGKWGISTVMCVIKNEKYKGDVLMGKTFTTDPITKRRLKNRGEQDQYYIKNHHEAIISEELFEKANAIRLKRVGPNKSQTNKLRRKYNRQYCFSSMLYCGYCGDSLSRRTWHSSSKYYKIIWQCSTATKKGKINCKHSKAIEESVIEKAFTESYRIMCCGNKNVLDEFLHKFEETIKGDNSEKEYKKTQRSLYEINKKRKKLLDNYLSGVVSPDIYKQLDIEYEKKVAEYDKAIALYEDKIDENSLMKKRLEIFKKTLAQNSDQIEFDKNIFESIISKVIVGGYDETGTEDPYKLSFIYKTGFEIDIDNSKELFGKKRKNGLTDLPSDNSYELRSVVSNDQNDTCGDGMLAVEESLILCGVRAIF